VCLITAITELFYIGCLLALLSVSSGDFECLFKVIQGQIDKQEGNLITVHKLVVLSTVCLMFTVNTLILCLCAPAGL